MVAAYKEFAPKGFEIYAVSLDKTKEAWQKGIADLNLRWKHVSELEHPTKILKGGYVMGATRQKPEMKGRTYGDPHSADLSICDFDGKIVRNSKVRVVRDNIVVFEGDLASLRRFKDDVKEVAAGYECGLQVDKYNDVKVGDVIEVYVMEEIKQ